MKTVIASLAAAFALSLASPLVLSDAAFAKKGPAMKTCKMKSGKKRMTWKCAPSQACCVTADGKGVCGMEGLGCF